jgi:carbamoyltransferase
MIVLGFHPGNHDAAAALFDDYRLVAAVAQERLTRRKSDGDGIPDDAIDECLAIAHLARADVDAVALTRTRLPWRYYTHFRGGRWVEGKVRQLLGREKHKDMFLELRRAGRTRAADLLNVPRFLAELGFRADARVHFANHHFAHALPAVFFTDWDDALVYTADGGGDHLHYSVHRLRDGRLETVHGDDSTLLGAIPVDSVGLAYGYATQALGYRINRHEGKLTGLAAYGEATAYEELAARFRIEDDGRVRSDYPSYAAMRQHIFEVAQRTNPADLAASAQALLEALVPTAIDRLLEQGRQQNLGLAGGVFANVRLNRLLAETRGFGEVFVFPAMGDDGLAVGSALAFLLERDGLGPWLARRYRLADVYLGRDWGGEIDTLLAATPGIRRVSARPAEAAVARLVRGEAGALYTGRMEFGPRALGARSILASPAEREINTFLNDRLERSEFMPFAPVVGEDDAAEVFDLPAASRYASRFMTITCAVRDAWRERIPAVVHVDGTARPQVIGPNENPLYFDILQGFRAATGLPVLVNTSFNVHEEPIVNRPTECVKALTDGRVDFVVTDQGVYAPEAPAAPRPPAAKG